MRQRGSAGIALLSFVLPSSKEKRKANGLSFKISIGKGRSFALPPINSHGRELRSMVFLRLMHSCMTSVFSAMARRYWPCFPEGAITGPPALCTHLAHNRQTHVSPGFGPDKVAMTNFRVFARAEARAHMICWFMRRCFENYTALLRLPNIVATASLSCGSGLRPG